MSQNFDQIMSNQSDDELIKIITIDKEKYKEEALFAAKNEIQKRGITVNKIQEKEAALNKETQLIESIENKKPTKLTRFINFIIDTIAFNIIAIIAINLMAFISLAIIGSVSTELNFLLYICSFLVYYVFMEAKYQLTIGKYLTKTIVVMDNGNTPTMNEIFIRTLCRLIPFDRLSFLFSNTGFHDKLSNTTVIYKN